MRMFRRSKFQRHLVIPLMLVCFMAACHKWVPLEAPVEQALSEHHGKVRLTLEDGRRVEYGSGPAALAFWHSRAQPDTALSDIPKAEVRKTDVGATVGLVVGVAAAAIVVSVAAYEELCADEPFGCRALTQASTDKGYPREQLRGDETLKRH